MCYPWTSRLAEGAPTDELRAATRDVGSRQLNPLLHRLAVDRSNGRRVWLDQGGAVREHRDAARGDGDLSSEQFALLELLSLVLLDEGRHDEALEHPERVVAWPGAGKGGWRGSHLLRKRKRPLEYLSDSMASIDLDHLLPASTSAPVPEVFRGEDRRKRPTPRFSRFTLFGGRRRSVRRDYEQEGSFVDRYTMSMVLAIVWITLMNIGDSFFTLTHLQAGGIELNPVAAALLESGRSGFVIWKALLIAMALGVLTRAAVGGSQQELVHIGCWDRRRGIEPELPPGPPRVLQPVTLEYLSTKAAMDEPRFHQLRGPLSFDYPVE